MLTLQGQWSTLVGTGLAALGSLYILLARDRDVASQEDYPNTNHENISSHHCCEHDSSHGSSPANASSHYRDNASQTGIHMGAMGGERGSPPLLESNGNSDNDQDPDCSAVRITRTSTF